ncbi:MAG: hypothetical protein AAF658_14955, partial [Myxococcota bacterium]
AVAMLRLRLVDFENPNDRAWLWLEIGRVEEHRGQGRSALEAFAEAARLARQNHVFVEAVERFVAVARDQRLKLTTLPALDRYRALMTQNGMVDDGAREVLYQLARHLVSTGSPTAVDVLAGTVARDSLGRRILYVAGAAHLVRGELDRAAIRFEEAASLELSNRDERDRDVETLAWLALARLWTEQRKVEDAVYAYHQVPADSEYGATALLEIGWLALESGQDVAARAAFEALIETEPDVLGKQASLLRGYLLLQRGDFGAAERHYDSIHARFNQQLKGFDQAASVIEDPFDLVRECQTRQEAAASPLLRPVLLRPELARARKLETLAPELDALTESIEEQRLAVAALGAEDAATGPVAEARAQVRRLAGLLEKVERVEAAVGGGAFDSRRWRASRDDTVKVDPCCNTPHQRARALRRRLESSLRAAIGREEALESEVASQLADLQSLSERIRVERTRVADQVRRAQGALAHEAIESHRRELEELVLEGGSGALQAVWQSKEALSDRIYGLEIERKRFLQDLYEENRDAVLELHSSE